MTRSRTELDGSSSGGRDGVSMTGQFTLPPIAIQKVTKTGFPEFSLTSSASSS
jgi:hypothetical protein